MNEADALKRKAEVLESLDKIRAGHISQLEYQVRHGAKPPVDAYMKEERLEEFYSQKARQLRVINLELKNIELDKRLTAICEVKDDLQLLIELIAQADTNAALSNSYDPHRTRLVGLARQLTQEYDFYDYWGDQDESSSG